MKFKIENKCRVNVKNEARQGTSGRILTAVLAVFIVVCMLWVPAGAGAQESPITVGVVMAGGLGDRAFYDTAHRGLTRAERELGVRGIVYECGQKAENFAPQLTAAADACDLIFALGTVLEEPLVRVASRFPQKAFVHLDYVGDDKHISYVAFRENEGTFLAGALAGLMTKTNKVGAVGGEDTAVIRNYLAGYRDGLQRTNPRAELLVDIVQAWNDPGRAMELATSQFDRGADIVIQLAGASGLGIIGAAGDVSHWVIGSDAEQETFYPESVLTSVVKRSDAAIFRLSRDFINGRYQNGRVYSYGISEGGMGISLWTKEAQRNVPKEVIEKIRAMERDVRDGKIQVKSYK